MGTTLNCCDKVNQSILDPLTEFWEGFKIRGQPAAQYLENIEAIFKEQKIIVKSDWEKIIMDFFHHDSRDYHYIDHFLCTAFDFYYSRVSYLIPSFLFMFKFDLVETLNNFKHYFMDIYKNKKEWMAEKDGALLVSLDEIRNLLRVYIDLVSSFTVEYLPEKKLKKYSKFYEHYVQEYFIKQLLTSLKLKDSDTDQFVSFEDFLNLHYELLSDTCKMRIKLESIYMKILECKNTPFSIEKEGFNTRKPEKSLSMKPQLMERVMKENNEERKEVIEKKIGSTKQTRIRLNKFNRDQEF